MYEKTFVGPTYTIFNRVHGISDMNNVYTFQDTRQEEYLRELKRAQKDRQKDKPNA